MATVSTRRRGVSGRAGAGRGTIAGRPAGLLDAPAAAMLAAGEYRYAPGATAQEIAVRIGRDVDVVEVLLADELRRGHVERDDDGRFRASDRFVRAYGCALALLWGDG